MCVFVQNIHMFLHIDIYIYKYLYIYMCTVLMYMQIMHFNNRRCTFTLLQQLALGCFILKFWTTMVYRPMVISSFAFF